MDYGVSQQVTESWVNAEAVADHLGCSTDHVRKLYVAGRIPGMLVGNGRRKYPRFKISRVDAALEAQSFTELYPVGKVNSPVTSQVVFLDGGGAIS